MSPIKKFNKPKRTKKKRTTKRRRKRLFGVGHGPSNFHGLTGIVHLLNLRRPPKSRLKSLGWRCSLGWRWNWLEGARYQTQWTDQYQTGKKESNTRMDPSVSPMSQNSVVGGNGGGGNGMMTSSTTSDSNMADDPKQNLNQVINSIQKTLGLIHQLSLTVSSFNISSQLPLLQRLYVTFFSLYRSSLLLSAENPSLFSFIFMLLITFPLSSFSLHFFL